MRVHNGYREGRSMEKMGQRGKRGLYRRLFAGFFLLMLGGTIASRIYDSVTVPKVKTAWMKKKAVETRIVGRGTVRERELSFCGIYPGLRVVSVEAAPGKQVEEGDELFCYGQESMEEQKGRLKEELFKLRLELEREQVSGESYGKVTEGGLAAWELGLAERELSEGQQEYEESLREHQETLERLAQEYERKKTMTGEELWEQQKMQQESARQKLHSAENSRDSAVREARRKIEDLEEELEEMKAGEYEAEKLARKERELLRAREDLEELEDEWDGRIEDVELEMDLLDNQDERIRSGETSSHRLLLEAYEEAVRQQEKAIKEEEKKLDELEKNVERASWNLKNASGRDEEARLSNEQKKRLSGLIRQGLEMDIQAKERELQRLEAIMEAGGKVLAGQKGIVAEVELLAGKTVSGEECVSIAWGSFWFEGEFEKEGQKLGIGDVILIGVPGGNRKLEARIEEMNLSDPVTGVFRAELTGEELLLGTLTGYECAKKSEVFRQVIPRKGLRKDMKGYYCLVARPKRAILGEELVAERVNVQVIYEGDTEVAVEGGLQDSDEIIVEGNQIIMEGDRVRIVEGE